MDGVQHGGAGRVAARPFQAPTGGTLLVARGCWWQGGGQIVESQPSYISKGGHSLQTKNFANHWAIGIA